MSVIVQISDHMQMSKLVNDLTLASRVPSYLIMMMCISIILLKGWSQTTHLLSSSKFS
jgi:hypothetical protein